MAKYEIGKRNERNNENVDHKNQCDNSNNKEYAQNFHSFSDCDVNKNQFMGTAAEGHDYERAADSPLSGIQSIFAAPKTIQDNRKNSVPNPLTKNKLKV